MSWGEIFNYVIVGNPISKAVLSSGSAVLKNVSRKEITLLEMVGSSYHFVRLAGLSGAIAIIMSAYGKQNIAKIKDKQAQIDAKAVFEVASYFHFFHSCALLFVPLAHWPALTGSLMAAGCVLFVGPMYYRALTGDKTFIQVATCGGFCLIAAWLSIVF